MVENWEFFQFFEVFGPLRPEGGVEGSKKSLLRFGPARRAGPDEIVRIVLVHTVKEKFEVNICFKNAINLKKAQKG